MTKVLLVDDEAMIRKAIVNSVEWQNHGIEIIADVANGKEALMVLDEEVVDIVITDIRMPIMDGLKLSEEIKKHYPKTKIVILSGYDDFEYAREAIKKGVQDYLLKPVSEEELIPLIRRLEQEIGKEYENERQMFLSKKLLQENKVLICTKVLQDILMGKNGTEILAQAKKLGMNLEGPLFGVMLISADDYNVKYNSNSGEHQQLQRFAVYNVFEELFRGRLIGSVAYSGDEELVAVFSTRRLMRTQLYEVLKGIAKTIEEVLEVSISIAVGGKAGAMADIPQLYAEAKLASKKNFYAGKRQICIWDETKKIGEQKYGYKHADYEREFAKAFQNYSYEESIIAWRKIAEFFTREQTAEEDVKDTVVRLCKDIYSYMIEHGITFGEGENGGDENYFYVGELKKKKFFADINEYMINMIGNAHATIEKAANKRYSHMVRLAMSYLGENYSKDISLTEVADVIGVSANYFSKIFKKEVGTNFVDWFNQLRINKAKDILLKNTYKVYEVAEMVGYSEYKYFITMFKKYTGKTPKQFREKHI